MFQGVWRDVLTNILDEGKLIYLNSYLRGKTNKDKLKRQP